MIDLTNVPTARLHHELKLRKGPDWKCVKCGYYANGSGQWACQDAINGTIYWWV